jgi:CubicO group peptidase (beta-lactamase class C family)
MKKRSIGKKILIGCIAVLLLANIIVWFTGTTYIYKALVYQQPNIDDLSLFDYNTIKNNSAKTPWKIGSDYNTKTLTPELRTILDSFESVAFLVIKDDSIRHEEYHEGYSDSSYSNSFSMAKSIISILIGIAVDEGAIKNIDDPVGNYIEEFKEGDKAKITIKHVLQMASGLNFQESYSTPFNHTTDAYYGKNLKKLILSLDVMEEPGTVNRYKSGDTQLLELILKSATGKTVSEYASEKLWSKIGAEHEARWSVDHEKGDEKAYCCFYSNARDFARIGKLYLNEGMWDSTRVISKSWVEASVTPNGLPDETGSKTNNYGLQWWILNQDNEKVFYARGILGQYIIVIPSRKMVIVRLGKKRSQEKINNHPKDLYTFVEQSMLIFR